MYTRNGFNSTSVQRPVLYQYKLSFFLVCQCSHTTNFYTFCTREFDKALKVFHNDKPKVSTILVHRKVNFRGWSCYFRFSNVSLHSDFYSGFIVWKYASHAHNSLEKKVMKVCVFRRTSWINRRFHSSLLVLYFID